MQIPRSWQYLLGAVLLAVAGGGVYVTQDRWRSLISPPASPQESANAEAPVEDPKVLKLSPQARKNLNLVAKPARPQTYWRTIQIPGILADRPGESDRGITSPAVGVVTEVHAYPGQTVFPGQKLFTLKLSSEYLQNTQKELFTATNESQIVQAEIDRMRPLAESGAVAGTTLIQLEGQKRRQDALVQSHRQDLLTRGLTPQQVDQVSQGDFAPNVDITAPQLEPASRRVAAGPTEKGEEGDIQNFTAYEVQALNTELGQQVQAGQLLATLANHRNLYVEGHAFKREAPFLEDAVQNNWKIRVEFAEDRPEHWPQLEQEFEIQHLSNTIDPNNRTFAFYIPLTNQSRPYNKEGETFVVWRFRPGQRVRLHVPVEEIHNVLVLPSAAVVREGPEAYVFQQNGDLFNRIPVQALHEDRLNVVIANDGSITPGLYLAQNAAASLNRVLKAQAASGMRADVHVHADGTVHASH